MEHTQVIVDLSKHNMVTKTTDLTMLYSVYQRKGQIQATFKNVPIPERGSEVFIGNIPYGTLLQDLLEFGLKAGAIYQIRLLLEFSGRSRRYCFIKYFSPQSARKAVLTLNGGLLNRCHVIVKLSFDNNSLEIGDIPRELCFDQLKGQLQQVIGDGLKEVKLQKYPYLDCNKCLLVYDTHSNAAHARKKVYPTFRLLGHTVRIDWKVPVELKMCSRLYFRNLPSTVTKMQLCDSLLEHLCIDSMLNIFLQRGIGYIVFVTSYQAYQAYKTLSEKPICGVYLEYSFSRFFEE
nr:unnamed protein product [Callosobruchus chinensis]